MRTTSITSSYLFAHGKRDAAIAAAAAHDTVHAPRGAHGNKRRVQMTIDLHRNPVHLERNQGWGIAPPVHVRLVARHIRIVDDCRVADHGVEHRRPR